MTYDKEFEEWFNDNHVKGNYNELYKRDIFTAWQAARKDHYRIGEEVEARAHGMEGFSRGVITANISGGFAVVQPKNVRRNPAWEPKEGEAVLWRLGSSGVAGICVGASLVQFGDEKIRCFDMKPFSADKIGKNWEEI